MEDLKESKNKSANRKSPVPRLVILAVCVLLMAFSIPQGAMAAAPASVSVVSPETAPRAVSPVSAPMVGGAVPAVAVYPGARFGQIDILMDSVETERVAKSIWGGAVVCWPMIAGGMAGYSSCIALATVCAARAYLSSPRARAGITVTIWGYGWCWKY